MIDLRYLVTHDAFIVCSLLASDSFVSYCKEQGVDISRDKLEELEQLQVFSPIARIRCHVIKIKIKYVNDGKLWQNLGMLKEGEEWLGDVKEDYSAFRFERAFALSWLDEGQLWEPRSRPFEAWNTFYDEQGRKHTESYYSIFQVWHLAQVLKMSQTSVSLGPLLTRNEESEQKLLAHLNELANGMISALRKHRLQGEELALLCQALANRYFPQTQSDRRVITIRTNGFFHPEWDWHEYCQTWDASKRLTDTGLTPADIKNLHERVLSTATFVDPLERWYDLVSFIALSEKKKLKGSAHLAQSLYAMAEVLRLFYAEISDEKLSGPDDRPCINRKKFYGDKIVDNELRFLEVLTNQYHLNPKPRLILVVEGPGEEKELPRIAEQAFAIPFSLVGVEVMNLGGIENFSGKKDRDKYGALEKLIDSNHNRQTYVFVILDNEGRAAKVRTDLLKARSKFYPRRYVTNDNLVRLWKTSIEFDNFSHDEIAQAMTELAEGRYTFTSQEIAQCEDDQTAKKGDALRQLFHDKVNYTLSKPKLLGRLVDGILASPEKEKDENGQLKRELLRLVWEVVDLAVKNRQPVTIDMWQKTQDSGSFGKVEQ